MHENSGKGKIEKISKQRYFAGADILTSGLVFLKARLKLFYSSLEKDKFACQNIDSSTQPLFTDSLYENCLLTNSTLPGQGHVSQDTLSCELIQRECNLTEHRLEDVSNPL